jgi:hypothetical protein
LIVTSRPRATRKRSTSARCRREELLHLGVDLYNAGRIWNAHEAWEEVWLLVAILNRISSAIGRHFRTD